MRSLFLVAALLAVPILSGCVSPAVEVNPNIVIPMSGLLTSPDALWLDHENEPLPAWNWPTLTHPATGPGVPDFWKPIPNATVPAHIAGIKLAAKSPAEVPSGGGIALFGSIALVPGYGKESFVVDISSPEEPKLLASYPVNGSERGAAIMAMPDGRLYGVVSTNAGFNVVNLTDPTNPSVLTSVKAPRGGHKVGLVPGTPIVYNANSDGGAGAAFGATANIQSLAQGGTEIYDLTDPANPVLVQDFKNGYGCHHIYFWNDASQDKHRAICAGIQYTQIWDIADPLAPKVIVSVPVHHGVSALPSASVPIVMFSHLSILNQDGTILIVGDEMGGGSIPPGCTVPGAPTGAVWFYDVKDEKNPKLLGWFSPGTHLPKNDPTFSCTAHHGRLVPDPEGKRQLLALAFYGAGTVLVDFTNPMLPSQVGQFNEGTNTWEAWYYNGYVFTGDLARGMDVLSFK